MTAITFTRRALADGMTFVQVADAMDNRTEAVMEGSMALFLPVLVLIPVSVLLIWLIVRRALAPVDDLREAIEEKDGGNLAPVPSSMLPRELRPIASSVNRLLSRLQAAFDAEREFTANSAHELRTPIAGALAQTQMLIAELDGTDASGAPSRSRHRSPILAIRPRSCCSWHGPKPASAPVPSPSIWRGCWNWW